MSFTHCQICGVEWALHGTGCPTCSPTPAEQVATPLYLPKKSVENAMGDEIEALRAQLVEAKVGYEQAEGNYRKALLNLLSEQTINKRVSDDLRVALATIRALKRGSCWCELRIGNPMVRSHSAACDMARKIAGEDAPKPNEEKL